jgi:hypothetical protein
MRETLIQYETVLRGEDGRRYVAQSCGRERPDGTWEGWLEFIPEGGGEVIRTERETTQPSRDTLRYWATGLTDPYLDGALLRVQRASAAPGTSAAAARPHAPAAAAAGAVLDPFHVYDEGADVLQSQLRALSADQLRNIIRHYGLSTLEPRQLDALAKPELAALIMRAVEDRAAR